MAHERIALQQRFWAKVAKSDGCWIWQAQLNNKGYGCFAYERIPGKNTSRNMYAHRLSWMLLNGPIPPGMNVLHRCDTPACVNPDHLFLGSQRENMRDCVTKGRLAINRNKAKVTEEQVRAIRADTRRHHIIAADYGLKRNAVWKIKHRRSWAHVV